LGGYIRTRIYLAFNELSFRRVAKLEEDGPLACPENRLPAC